MVYMVVVSLICINIQMPNTAGIMMANARANYNSWQKTKRENDADRFAQGIAPLVFIGVIVAFVAFMCGSPGDELGYKTRSIPLERTAEVQYLLKNQNDPKNIELVLKVMRAQGVRDVNKDGLINCIDNSITFRMLYGDKAYLTINKNPFTGMNHMFVQVWDYGKYYDIEPQGTPDRYAMGQVWGMKYNPQYNRNATQTWSGYVGDL